MKITLTFPEVGADTSAMMDVFSRRAGEEIQQAVQAVLGTSEVYTLSAAYSKRKPTLKSFKRVAGKASDQPLILSAAMYESIEWERDGNTLCVGVADGAGFSEKGFDYAEHWEEIAQFLEKAIQHLGGEDRLSEILEGVILEHMGAD